MRVFNQDKSSPLFTFDLSKGKLQEDKLFIKTHEAIEAAPGKTAEEQAKELEATGQQVLRKNGKIFSIEKIYENGGRSLKELKDIPSIEGKAAWDEYEDIYVYIPFTAEEQQKHDTDLIRSRREFECFSVVDRGKLWYEGLTAAQLEELKAWYQAWLDAPQTGVIPDSLEWVK